MNTQLNEVKDLRTSEVLLQPHVYDLVFRILPGICKLEKCSLSPFLATEVRLRFQTRYTK